MDTWKSYKAQLLVSAEDVEAAEAISETIMDNLECGMVSESDGNVRIITITSGSDVFSSSPNPASPLKPVVEDAIAANMEKLTGYDAVYATYWDEYGYGPDPDPMDDANAEFVDGIAHEINMEK